MHWEWIRIFISQDRIFFLTFSSAMHKWYNKKFLFNIWSKFHIQWKKINMFFFYLLKKNFSLISAYNHSKIFNSACFYGIHNIHDCHWNIKMDRYFHVKILAHAVTYLLFSQFENNIFDIQTVGKKHLYRITFIQ